MQKIVILDTKKVEKAASRCIFTFNAIFLQHLIVFISAVIKLVVAALNGESYRRATNIYGDDIQ
jgi:hypothetical protein